MSLRTNKIQPPINGSRNDARERMWNRGERSIPIALGSRKELGIDSTVSNDYLRLSLTYNILILALNRYRHKVTGECRGSSITVNGGILADVGSQTPLGNATDVTSRKWDLGKL